MKQITLLLLCCVLSISCFAQDIIKIDLAQWKGKVAKVPFNINSIKDGRVHPMQIGTINIKRGKKKRIDFESNSEVMIQQFIDKNFDEGQELNIRLKIERLSIEEVLNKKNKKMTAFVFACAFYKENDSVSIYSFNARNSIPKKNALKLSMTNYIGRAITSAIVNFKKSYKRHPEWRKGPSIGPQIKINKELIFNSFVGGDTIGLSGNYNLSSSDFAGIYGEDEADNAYSYFMITYGLDSKDKGKEITLKITTKAYFLRSKSWAKKTADTQWLNHQQLLFDLASYHALSLKKQLEEKEFTAGFYKAEANKIYNKVSAAYFDEMDALQAETQYGENSEKAALWRAKVNKYLGR